MKHNIATVTQAALLVAWAFPANACTPSHSLAAQNAFFDGTTTDTASLNDSFVSEINAHRCEHGLPALTYNSTLGVASKYHSDWMNETKIFAHDSTVSGMEKPWDRAKHFGYAYSTIAENLALYGRYDFSGESFYINGTCDFSRKSGEKINPISYDALAKQVGIGWMNSPGHRANILREGITEAGVEVSIDYDAEHCGRIYVTMLYGSPLN